MTNAMQTKQSYEQSRRYIESNARPLEIARFHSVFDGASISPVMDALQSYQNPDGGFGHALEPDFRADESSALCTSIAFEILRSIQAPPEAFLVKSGIAYLLETLNTQTLHWQIIPLSAGQSPHAPWWDTAGREQEFASFSLNPTAELLGCLYNYQELVPAQVLSRLSQQVMHQLSGLDKIEMHELMCCLRMLQSRNLPREIYQPAIMKLSYLIDGALSTDPVQWAGYGLRPLQVIDSPESPFMAGRAQLVATNLEYEISTQNADGSWSPNWSWGALFPDDWIHAQREWSGVLTLDKLMLLKRFHRIEGIS